MKTQLRNISVILALLTQFIPKVYSTPSEADFISAGRTHLANQTPQELQAADESFAAALSLNPNNEEANALHALTSVVLLEAQPALQNTLSVWGIQLTNANIYNLQYNVITDLNGTLDPSPSANSDIVLGYLKNSVLPSVSGALANLQKITSPTFKIHLSAAETALKPTDFDYGDVQILRSILSGLRSGILLINSYNFSATFSAVKNLTLDGNLTISEIFGLYPNLLAFSSSDSRALSKTALQSAANDYLNGSYFVRSRNPLSSSNPLFIIENDTAQDEQNFRNQLTAVVSSLSAPSMVDGVLLNLSALFESRRSPRSFFGQLKDGLFLRNTWPDPTLGGVLSFGSQSILNNKAEANNLLSLLSGTPTSYPDDIPADTRVVSLGGKLNFGTQKIRSKVKRVLTITNLGNAPLTVFQVRLPAGFNGNFSGVIPEGQSHSVPIVFQPRQKKTYRGTISVVSDSTEGPSSRAISGSGKY